jgi:hypothetical protein
MADMEPTTTTAVTAVSMMVIRISFMVHLSDVFGG